MMTVFGKRRRTSEIISEDEEPPILTLKELLKLTVNSDHVLAIQEEEYDKTLLQYEATIIFLKKKIEYLEELLESTRKNLRQSGVPRLAKYA